MNSNPYIGPRPFAREDQDLFFGREAESRELLKLIASRREVLIYSPAGAGKTSLLNARILPGLEARGLHVYPVARVGAALPPGIDPAEVKNIFVFSTLLGLFPHQENPAALLEMTLTDGLCELEKGFAEVIDPVRSRNGRRDLTKGTGSVLIFDQFEEILTAHRERWADAWGFFDQMNAALENDPRLAVVVLIREDHLAGLDPYLALLPGKQRGAHRANFRLGALDAAAALEAVTRPAGLAGVPFASGVAERLVTDLRRASGLSAYGVSGRPPVANGGRVEPPPGPVVEPVLLQLACCQLWANLPDQADAVHLAHLPRFLRDRDYNLTLYYETAVRAAAASGGVTEWEVRRWFSQQLITQDGTRAMVRQDLLETAGLTNLAVLELADLHVLVAHQAAGSCWYELSLDGLIEPIRASNWAFEQARETPLRKTARLWKISGEAGLLYSGRALKAARRWVDAAALSGPGEVELAEIEFVRASHKAEQAQVTLRGWIIIGVIGLVLLAVSLGFLTSSAQIKANRSKQTELEVQKERATAVVSAQLANEQRAAALQAEETAKRDQDAAENQAQLAMSREYASLGRSALAQEKPQLSLLLALQGLFHAQQSGEIRSVPGEQILRDALGQVSGIPLQGHTLGINGMASSLDRRWLATVSDDGTVRLWNLNSAQPGENSILLKPNVGWLSAVSFSPDSRWLAVSGADTSVRVWDMTPFNDAVAAGAAPPDFASAPIVLPGHKAAVEVLRFSSDGRWLISGSADESVRLWDTSRFNYVQTPLVLTGLGDAVSLIAISPDSHWAAAGERNGTIWVWNLWAGDVPGSGRKMALRDRPFALSFSPDGRWLAAAGRDQRVVLFDLWTLDPNAVPLTLGRHEGLVRALAFSPDGCWLASGGADKKIFLWYMGIHGTGERPGQIFYTLSGHTDGIETLAFPKMVGPVEKYQAIKLASGGADHTVRVWDLIPVVVQGKDCRRPVPQPGQNPLPMPDVRTTDFSVTVLRGLDGVIQKLDFAADNRWLAAAGADGSARLWDLRHLSSSEDPFQYDTTGVGPMYATAVSRDGRWVAATGVEGVFTWPLQDETASPQLVGCGRVGAYSLQSGVRGLMAAGCLDGSVVLWDTNQLRGEMPFLPEKLPGLQGVVYAVALSPDGQWLAAGDETGRLQIWPLAHGAPSGAPQVLMTDGGTVYNLVFDPRGRWLASADAKGRVMLWNPASFSGNGGASPAEAKPLAVLQVSSAPVYALSASLDGNWLAAGTWDQNGQVRLWDMNALTPGQEPPAFTLTGFINQIYALTFSPDTRWLAVGSADFSLRQWDLARLAPLDPAQNPVPDPQIYSDLLDDHQNVVYQAVYSPDSRWLLSASGDHTIRQWDTETPQALPVIFNGHSLAVRMVVVTPDGQYAISAGEDGSLRRWSLMLSELQREGCALTQRNLTAYEIRRYLHETDLSPVCQLADTPDQP